MRGAQMPRPQARPQVAPQPGLEDTRAHYRRLATQSGRMNDAWNGMQVGDVGPDRRRYLGMNRSGLFGNFKPQFDEAIPQDLGQQGQFFNNDMRRVRPTQMSPGQDQAWRRQRAMDLSQKALREQGASAGSGMDQLLGTTPANVRGGIQAQQMGTQQALQAGLSPAMAQRFGRHQNAMSPVNDRMDPGIYRSLTNPSGVRDFSMGLRRHALDSAGRAVRGVPNVMAGGMAMIPAMAMDAGGLAGGDTSFRHTRGAAVDAARPLTATGFNPFRGEKSFHDELMPGYAQRVEDWSAQPGRAPGSRIMGEALGGTLRQTNFLGAMAGMGGLTGGGLSQSFRMAPAASMPTVSGALASSGNALLQKAAPAVGAVGGTMKGLGAMDPKSLAIGGALGTAVPFYNEMTGQGPEAAMENATVNAQQQAYRQLSRYPTVQDIPDGTAPSATMPSGGGAAPTPAPAMASAAGEAAKANPVIARAKSPEVAAQASQGFASLAERAKQVQNPAELQGEYSTHLTNYVEALDDTQKATVQNVVKGQLGPAELQTIAQTPGAQEIAARAQESGFNPMEAITQFFTSQDTEWWQKALVGIGLPLAVVGLGHAIFGENQLGGLLTTVLGLGGAAVGAAGGIQPLMQGAQDLYQSYMGGGTPAAGQDPSTPPPVPGAGTPPAPAPPMPSGPAGPAGTWPQMPPALSNALADSRIDATERDQLFRDPAMLAALRQAPPASRDQVLQASLQGDPSFAQQMASAQTGYNLPFGMGRNAVYGKAQGMGLQPEDVDMMMESMGRVGG